MRFVCVASAAVGPRRRSRPRRLHGQYQDRYDTLGVTARIHPYITENIRLALLVCACSPCVRGLSDGPLNRGIPGAKVRNRARGSSGGLSSDAPNWHPPVRQVHVGRIALFTLRARHAGPRSRQDRSSREHDFRLNGMGTELRSEKHSHLSRQFCAQHIRAQA